MSTRRRRRWACVRIVGAFCAACVKSSWGAQIFCPDCVYAQKGSTRQDALETQRTKFDSIALALAIWAAVGFLLHRHHCAAFPGHGDLRVEAAEQHCAPQPLAPVHRDWNFYFGDCGDDGADYRFDLCNEAKILKRLPARRWGALRRASLWDAGEYLLSVSGTSFSEHYRRFYYRDIQSIVVQKGPRLGSIGGLLIPWFITTIFGSDRRWTGLTAGVSLAVAGAAGVVNLGDLREPGARMPGVCLYGR